MSAPRCRHRGTDLVSTLSGYDVRLEAGELDALGELRAVLAGRRTFTAHVAGGVAYRDASVIRRRPAGTQPRQTVRVQHQCPTPEANP